MKTDSASFRSFSPILPQSWRPVRISVALAAMLLLGAAPASAQFFAPKVTKLLGRATTSQVSNQFGIAVAVTDRFLLVGDRFNNDVAVAAGAAHLFDARNGRYLRKLTAPDGAAGDEFGSAVALCGNLALVGAPSDDDKGSDSGSAYVFDVRTGKLLFKLIAGDGSAFDELGFSVALSGNLALVGMPEDDVNAVDSGSAYVFDVRTGALVFKLRAFTGFSSNARFGYSVALSGKLALVGAPDGDGLVADSGVAYVFDARAGTQLATLVAPDGAADDFFGGSVALCGNLALAGAPLDDDMGFNSGAAYVFDARSGAQLAKLTANDGAAFDFFGGSVALCGNLALVGATGDDDKGSMSGAVYVFDARKGVQLAKLTAPDGAINDFFGGSVALCGNLALAGAPLDDDQDFDSGAAYFFRDVAGPLPMRILAQARDFAPGTGGGDYRVFGDAVINFHGEAAFEARLAGAGRGTAARGLFWSSVNFSPFVGLVARGGTDLGGGLLVNAVGNPVYNHQDDLIFQGTVKGTGVNSGNNNALFHSFNGAPPSAFLREGDSPPAFNGAVLNRFYEVVQSHTGAAGDVAAAIQFKRGPGGVSSASDSGVLAVDVNGALVDVFRENSALASLPGVFWGQFNRRIAKVGEYMVWSSFLKGPNVTSANNQGLFQIIPGATQEILRARKGNIVTGGILRSFLGEAIDTSSDVTYRASLSSAPSNKNQILVHAATRVWTKGDLTDSFDPSLQPGTRLVRLLKFWPIDNNLVMFLARMAGPGVSARNDTALWLWDNNNGQGATTLQMLFREGDDAAACDGAKVRTIQRVAVEPFGNYAILASLTGRSSANQAMFTGNAAIGNETTHRALRLPVPILRKGTSYQAATGQTTQIRSMSLTETTDRSGAGTKGGPQVVSFFGGTILEILFNNRTRVLASGQP